MRGASPASDARSCRAAEELRVVRRQINPPPGKDPELAFYRCAGPATTPVPERGWEFLRPDRSPIPTVAAALSGNAESLIEMHTRARLRIDHTTLTPDWDGDRLDPEPILDALLPRRIKAAA
jgi:hypothetical protein